MGSGAPVRSLRTSRAGAASIVKTISCGVFASRSNGGPGNVSAAHAAPAAAQAARRERVWDRKARASAKDRLHGAGRVREIGQNDVGARPPERLGGRPARRDGDDPRPERERAGDVLRRVAHDDAIGSGKRKAEPAGLRERDRAEVLAAGGLVAVGPERESLPEADGCELDARPAFDVAGQDRGDGRLPARDAVEDGRDARLQDGPFEGRARPRAGRDRERGRRPCGGGPSPPGRPRRRGARAR